MKWVAKIFVHSSPVRRVAALREDVIHVTTDLRDVRRIDE
jgi:hypothetical protein